MKPSLADPARFWRDPKAKTIGYFAKDGHVLVDRGLCAELKAEALATGRNARLSLHAGPDELLHQMVIVQHRSHYNRPKLHMGKAKSWHLIEGRMAIVVFDETGKVVERTVLDEREAFLYRLPADLYHTNVPLTPHVIHQEILLGPFVGDSDRRYGAFSPDGSDQAAAADYILGLVRDLLSND